MKLSEAYKEFNEKTQKLLDTYFPGYPDEIKNEFLMESEEMLAPVVENYALGSMDELYIPEDEMDKIVSKELSSRVSHKSPAEYQIEAEAGLIKMYEDRVTDNTDLAIAQLSYGDIEGCKEYLNSVKESMENYKDAVGNSFIARENHELYNDISDMLDDITNDIDELSQEIDEYEIDPYTAEELADNVREKVSQMSISQPARAGGYEEPEL